MFLYSFLMTSWPGRVFFFLTRGEGAELRNAFNPLDYKQFKILLLSLLLVLNPYQSYHSFSRKKLGHIVCSSRSFGGSAVDQWGHLLINMISVMVIEKLEVSWGAFWQTLCVVPNHHQSSCRGSCGQRQKTIITCCGFSR